MAKRTTSGNGSKKSAAKSVSTPVRNSAIPRSAASAPTASRSSSFGSTATAGTRQITHEMIAKRAYEIWQSGKGGSQYDNWVRAERELRAGLK
jgi:hypothetical protein